VFCQLGLHVVVCNTCAPARSGIVKKRVAGWVGVSGTPERKPGNAAGFKKSKNNLPRVFLRAPSLGNVFSDDHVMIFRSHKPHARSRVEL